MSTSRQNKLIKLKKRIQEKLCNIDEQREILTAILDQYVSEIRLEAESLLSVTDPTKFTQKYMHVILDLERCYNGFELIIAQAESLSENDDGAFAENAEETDDTTTECHSEKNTVDSNISSEQVEGQKSISETLNICASETSVKLLSTDTEQQKPLPSNRNNSSSSDAETIPFNTDSSCKSVTDDVEQPSNKNNSSAFDTSETKPFNIDFACKSVTEDVEQPSNKNNSSAFDAAETKPFTTDSTCKSVIDNVQQTSNKNKSSASDTTETNPFATDSSCKSVTDDAEQGSAVAMETIPVSVNEGDHFVKPFADKKVMNIGAEEFDDNSVLPASSKSTVRNLPTEFSLVPKDVRPKINTEVAKRFLSNILAKNNRENKKMSKSQSEVENPPSPDDNTANTGNEKFSMILEKFENNDGKIQPESCQKTKEMKQVDKEPVLYSYKAEEEKFHPDEQKVQDIDTAAMKTAARDRVRLNRERMDADVIVESDSDEEERLMVKSTDTYSAFPPKMPDTGSRGPDSKIDDKPLATFQIETKPVTKLDSNIAVEFNKDQEEFKKISEEASTEQKFTDLALAVLTEKRETKAKTEKQEVTIKTEKQEVEIEEEDYGLGPELKNADLPARSITPVEVSEPGSPWNFYVQMCGTDLNKLMEEICVYMTKRLAKPISNPMEGMRCLAQFSKDSVYYRAKVTSVYSPGKDKSVSVDVVFVDYGNGEKRKSTHLRELPEKFSVLPAQAICCAIAKVAPANKYDVWTEGDILYFTQFVSNQQFHCIPVFHSDDPSFPHLIDLFLNFPVQTLKGGQLFMQPSVGQIIVSTLLINQGCAKKIDVSDQLLLLGMSEEDIKFSFLKPKMDNENKDKEKNENEQSSIQRDRSSSFEHQIPRNVGECESVDSAMNKLDLMDMDKVSVKSASSVVSESCSLEVKSENTSIKSKEEVKVTLRDERKMKSKDSTEVKTSKSKDEAKVTSEEEVKRKSSDDIKMKTSDENRNAKGAKSKMKQKLSKETFSGNNLNIDNSAQNLNSNANASNSLDNINKSVIDLAQNNVNISVNERNNQISKGNDNEVKIQNTQPDLGQEVHKQMVFDDEISTTSTESEQVNLPMDLSFGGQTEELSYLYNQGHKVMLSHIKSPEDFYVHIVNESTGRTLDKLMKSLNKTFEQKSKKKLLKLSKSFQPVVKELCCAQFSDDSCFYRAQITEVKLYSPNKSAMASEQGTNIESYRVFYMDFGDSEWLPKKKLFPLPEEYMGIPPLAIHCSLAYIRPNIQHKDVVDNMSPVGIWPKKAIETFCSLTDFEKLYDMLIVSGNIDKVRVPETDGTPLKILLVDNSQSEEICINMDLIRLGVAMIDTSHTNANDTKVVESPTSPDLMMDWDPMMDDFLSIRNSYNVDIDDAGVATVGYKAQDEKRICKYFNSNSCWRGERCPFRHVRTSSDYITLDREAVFGGLDDYHQEELLPEAGTWVAIEISTIIDPGHFYIILPWGKKSLDTLNKESEDGYGSLHEEHEETLEDLMASMSEHYGTKTLSDRNLIHLAPGELVASRFSLDGQWYRAKVITTDEDRVQVFYVDFGNKEWVPERTVRLMEPQFLHLPFQAIESFLLDVEPINQWTTESRHKFRELVDGKTLVAHVKQRSWNGCLWIDLFDTTSPEDISIAKALIGMGLAQEPSSHSDSSSGIHRTSSESSFIFVPG